MANLQTNSVAQAYSKEWIPIVVPLLHYGFTEQNINIRVYSCLSYRLFAEMRKYADIGVLKNTVNRTPFSSMTPLQRAASRVLFEKELALQEIKVINADLSKLFHSYIKEGNLFLASAMLAQQDDPAERIKILLSENEDGETAVEWAIFNKRIQTCHRLLAEAGEHKEELLHHEHFSETPLYIANRLGDTKMVRMLLSLTPAHLKCSLIMKQNAIGNTVMHQIARNCLYPMPPMNHIPTMDEVASHYSSEAASRYSELATKRSLPTAKLFLNILTSAGVPQQELLGIKNVYQQTAADLCDNTILKQLLSGQQHTG